MRYDEYRAHDALGLAELVARGEVHATELLELALSRTAEVDPAVNAVSLLMEQNGKELAQAVFIGRLSVGLLAVLFVRSLARVSPCAVVESSAWAKP